MWPFGMACPTEPRGKPLLAGLRLPGRAHGLAAWEGLWEWAPGGVSAAHPGANSSSRLLCVAVGQLDRPPALTDDGYDLGSCVGPVSQVGQGEHITLDSWVTDGRGLLQLEFQKGPMGAMPGGSPALRVSSPSISAPELSPHLSGLWRVGDISRTSTCIHMLALPWKEESMAEHWGQGGKCPVHVPRLCATASGEWGVTGQDSCAH